MSDTRVTLYGGPQDGAELTVQAGTNELHVPLPPATVSRQLPGDSPELELHAATYTRDESGRFVYQRPAS